MLDFTKKPKTISASFTLNVHEGSEDKTVNEAQQILTRATPDEVELLSRLFDNERLRSMALKAADKMLPKTKS